MKKTFLNYEASVEFNGEEMERIVCQDRFNTVEVSYHQIDECAEDEEEAIDFFIEWLGEQEEARKEAAQAIGGF